MPAQHPAVTWDEVEKLRQAVVDLKVRARLHNQSLWLIGDLTTASTALEFATAAAHSLPEQYRPSEENNG